MAVRSSRVAQSVILTLIVAGAALLYQYRNRGADPSAQQRALQAASEEYFSPASNLEQMDIARIRGAQHTLDIAMYAFTDKFVADALIEAARRGVTVRIYRDRQQYEDEQRNAGEHASSSTTDLLRREPNVQIRVKGKRELMHLKAYLVDGRLLRDGSANWSPSGLKRQDNNARFTADPAQVKAFQQAFEDMWSRETNTEVH